MPTSTRERVRNRRQTERNPAETKGNRITAKAVREMARVGIVGHGEDKFTLEGREAAELIIIDLLERGDVMVSGHSPVGGIDIWAEDIALSLGATLDLKVPKQNKWDAEYGFKQRNLDIARDSDEVHVILVDVLPNEYQGRRFAKCYHCNTDAHVKSGGCWTGKQAEKLGKPVTWHIVKNYEA
jgi:hypothetical protein